MKKRGLKSIEGTTGGGNSHQRRLRRRLLERWDQEELESRNSPLGRLITAALCEKYEAPLPPGMDERFKAAMSREFPWFRRPSLFVRMRDAVLSIFGRRHAKTAMADAGA